MKIVMLTPYLPYPLLSGGQIRTYNLLKQLATKHEITLFALIKEDYERQYIPELEKFCKKVKVFRRPRKPFTLKNILATAISPFPFLVIRNFSSEAQKAIAQELAETKYDLIHAETFYMMPHLPQTSIPIILVEQTIEYLGYESFAKKMRWQLLRPLLNIDLNKIRTWEHHYWNICNNLIVMSEADQELVSQVVPAHKVAVVSNGVDAAWFGEKKKKLPKAPTLLSVGTFNWLPNVEATAFLVHKVWPLVKQQLPSAVLWIVGNNPNQEVLSYAKKFQDVTVTGGIPDIRDAFNQAHCLVAPVFSGKGTRYKILEAMASRTPIVATGTAVEGLGVENYTHVVTADTAETLAKAAVEVLTSPQLQQKLAKHGHAFVSTHFDWPHIADTLDTIYTQYIKPATKANPHD